MDEDVDAETGKMFAVLVTVVFDVLNPVVVFDTNVVNAGGVEIVIDEADVAIFLADIIVTDISLEGEDVSFVKVGSCGVDLVGEDDGNVVVVSGVLLIVIDEVDIGIFLVELSVTSIVV